MRMIVATVVAVALAGAVTAADLKFSGADSKIEFLGTKKDGSHTGGFKEFTGTLSMPGSDLAGATVTVEMKTGSLYSDNMMLTRHLKSPDFFDVNKHTKATFKSTAIKAAAGAGGATHEIAGDLTLLGVTKPVKVPVKATADAKGVSLSGTFTIQREDFGMTYGKGQVNNDVKVTITVKAAK